MEGRCINDLLEFVIKVVLSLCLRDDQCRLLTVCNSGDAARASKNVLILEEAVFVAGHG